MGVIATPAPVKTSVVSLTLLYGSSPLIRHPCEGRDPG